MFPAITVASCEWISYTFDKSPWGVKRAALSGGAA